MPTYGGASIFGLAVKMTTDPQPRPAQKNTFPGLSGVESLDEGDRGQKTYCTGVLVGANAAALFSAKLLFMSYKDNIPRVLVDSYGNAWSNVILEVFRQTSKQVRQDPLGEFFIEYEAEFTHLTAT